jgi:hypothetical protein
VSPETALTVERRVSGARVREVDAVRVVHYALCMQTVPGADG